MSKHLTDKEIDRLISGLASAGDVKKAEEHLSSCPQCWSVVNALSSVVAKQPDDSVPGEHVRKAVIAYWHRVNDAEAEKHVRVKPRFSRFTAGIAAAASIVIAVSSYVFFGIIKQEDIYPLTIKSIAGEVYLNDSAAEAGTPFKSGSIIKTGIDGKAEISTEGYTVYISESSSLELSVNSKRSGIRFGLREGVILSKSSGNTIYSFNCGKFKVTPAGTEFILRYSGENLDAEVTQGKISITGSGLNAEVSAGQKWTSENPDIVENSDAGAEAVINSAKLPGKSDLINNMTKAGNITTEEKTENKENRKNSSPDKAYRLDETKERNEKIKFDRDLIDEMKEMKKEQRRERKGRNRD